MIDDALAILDGAAQDLDKLVHLTKVGKPISMHDALDYHLSVPRFIIQNLMSYGGLDEKQIEKAIDDLELLTPEGFEEMFWRNNR